MQLKPVLFLVPHSRPAAAMLLPSPPRPQGAARPVAPALRGLRRQWRRRPRQKLGEKTWGYQILTDIYLSISFYIYIYIYVYLCTHIYIYIYIYIDR